MYNLAKWSHKHVGCIPIHHDRVRVMLYREHPTGLAKPITAWMETGSCPNSAVRQLGLHSFGVDLLDKFAHFTTVTTDVEATVFYTVQTNLILPSFKPRFCIYRIPDLTTAQVSIETLAIINQALTKLKATFVPPPNRWIGNRPSCRCNGDTSKLCRDLCIQPH